MGKSLIAVEAGFFDCEVRFGEKYREVMAELVGSKRFRPAVHANSPRGIRDAQSRDVEVRSLEELVDGWYWDLHPDSLAQDDLYRHQLGHDMRAYHLTKPTASHACSLLWSVPWLPGCSLKSMTIFHQWKDGSYGDGTFGGLIVSHQDPHPHYLGILSPRNQTSPVPESDTLISRAEGLNLYMEDLRRLTVEFLYPSLAPAFAYIGKSWHPGEVEQDRPPYFAAHRLTRLDWTNLFGPGYVKAYGREFLLGAPGYRKEELPDGGVLYQVTERFMNLEEPMPTAKEVGAYFRSHPEISRFTYTSRLAKNYFVDLKRSRAARDRYYRRKP